MVSIIIPVYNLENYIEKCIRSVINQTYNNIQIIVIDDGSTDSTGKICDELGKSDSRVLVIHTSNNGVSKARNIGIGRAVGDWIVFLDADDFISSNYIEIMYQSIADNSDCELVLCGYTEHKGTKKKEVSFFKSNDLNLRNKAFLLQRILGVEDSKWSNGKRFGCPWGKMYKASVIKNGSIRFPEDLSMGEDMIFNLSYVECMKGISIYNNVCTYNYIVRRSSATRHSNEEEFLNSARKYLESLHDCITNLDSLNNKEDIFNYRVVFLLYRIITVVYVKGNFIKGYRQSHNQIKALCEHRIFRQAVACDNNYLFNIKKLLFKVCVYYKFYFLAYCMCLYKKLLEA